MKCISLLFSFIILINFTCAAQWQQLQGPTGSRTGEMLEAGGFLFVNGIHGGIYRSSNDGLTWQAVNNGMPADYTTWAFSSYNDKIYVANSLGAYYSDDFGSSWTLLIDMLDKPSKGLYSIDVYGNQIYGGSSGGYYYSPDHGATWTFVSAGLSTAQILGVKLVDGRVWIASTNGLYFSDDNGITCTLKLNISVRQLLHYGNQLWIGNNDLANKFLVSYDKGTTFISLNIPSSGFVEGIFVEGNEVYVTTGAFSYCYSSDNGASWSQEIVPSNYSSINISAGSKIYKKGSALFISSYDGVLYSGDMGATWNTRNIGLLNQSINEVGLLANTIICNTYYSGTLFSVNDGDTWSKVNDPFMLSESFHIEKNTLVVSTARDVYKSQNVNQNWQQLLHLEATQQDDNFRIYFTGHGERLMLSTLKGVHFSKDLGTTWKFKSNTVLNFNERINRHYIQGDTIILETTNKFFTSTDFGETWIEKAAPRNYFYSTGFLLDDTSLILATLQGLYVSYDFGISWELRPCAPYVINDIKRVGKDIFIATSTGVYASPNEGLDWYPASKGLESSVLSIAIDSKYTFAGTYGRSMWQVPTAELLSYSNGQEASVPVVKNDCGTLTITNFAKGDVTWYKDNEPIPNENSVLLKANKSGAYKAVINTPCGRLLSNKIVINDNLPKPIVDVDCSTLTVKNSNATTQIIWYLNDQQISTEQQFVAQESGTYRVEFQNSCESTFSDPISMYAKKDIEVYNIITPNDDGKNDYYTLTNALAGSELSIYNRWGELIHESHTYENNWSADEVASGIYFYIINNKCFGMYKGVLTIAK